MVIVRGRSATAVQVIVYISMETSLFLFLTEGLCSVRSSDRFFDARGPTQFTAWYARNLLGQSTGPMRMIRRSGHEALAVVVSRRNILKVYPSNSKTSS